MLSVYKISQTIRRLLWTQQRPDEARLEASATFNLNTWFISLTWFHYIFWEKQWLSPSQCLKVHQVCLFYLQSCSKFQKLNHLHRLMYYCVHVCFSYHVPDDCPPLSCLSLLITPLIVLVTVNLHHYCQTTPHFLALRDLLWVCLSSSCTGQPSTGHSAVHDQGQTSPIINNICVVHLVLLTASFFIVVEDVLSDVFPSVVVGGDVVNAFLHSLVTSPTSVEEDAQQQHWRKDIQQSSPDVYAMWHFGPCSNLYVEVKHQGHQDGSLWHTKVTAEGRHTFQWGLAVSQQGSGVRQQRIQKISWTQYEHLCRIFPQSLVSMPSI